MSPQELTARARAAVQAAFQARRERLLGAAGRLAADASGRPCPELTGPALGAERSLALLRADRGMPDGDALLVG